MKVILRENVENLGKIGDVVKVSDGYARNYLLPRNLVVAADEQNVKSIEHHKRALSRKRLREQKDAEIIAQNLQGMTCTISRRAGDGEKLFGSVSSHDIVDALAEKGIKVERRQIVLEEPIKRVGEYKIIVKLLPEISAELKLVVSPVS